MNENVCVIGLGYVGLPLAVALARTNRVIGFDAKVERIAELQKGHDRNGEVDAATLHASALQLTSDAAASVGRDIYIITVPTPVDDTNRPDLALVRAACQAVGKVL